MIMQKVVFNVMVVKFILLKKVMKIDLIKKN